MTPHSRRRWHRFAPVVALVACSRGENPAAPGAAPVVHAAPAAVASVTVTPPTAELRVGKSVQLLVTLEDSSGQPLLGRPIRWTSTNSDVLRVVDAGLVTAVAPGVAAITASSEGKSASATITVAANPDIPLLPAKIVSAGADGATCSVTSTGAAYCWGTENEVVDVSAADRTVPVAVRGGIAFATVGVGAFHACGLSTSGAAYCWGNNLFGQLGDGTSVEASGPVAVAGGLRFASMSVGYEHTCAVTAGGDAFCWGYNAYGQLGDGTTRVFAGSPLPSTPVHVASESTFAMVSAGRSSTCGMTTSGRAYCWGLSAQGILGNGTTTNLPQQVPVAVAGGLTFTTISVGELHACGVTPDGAAYCWGFNRTGNLGDGTTTTAMTPVAVKGGLAFASISAGTAVHIDETNENPIGTRTCGVTIGGVGYCWGDGLSGSLGNGASFPSWTPAALAGGLTFRSITVGNGHACGVTTSDVAYCWGDNSHGQFGNGTLIYSPTPVRVGAMP